MFTDDMTPLQRAQKFSREFESTRTRIYNQLRRYGWSHDEALLEADARERRALQRAEEP